MRSDNVRDTMTAHPDEEGSAGTGALENNVTAPNEHSGTVLLRRLSLGVDVFARAGAVWSRAHAPNRRNRH